jgi:hypothetical protein
MLTIRNEQIQALDQAVVRTLEKEILQYLKLTFPADCELLGEDEARAMIRDGALRARGCGLKMASGVRAFVDLMFLLGSGFDSDPRFPALRGLLTASGRDEDARVEDLSRLAKDYRERVEGPARKHLMAAARRFDTQHITAAPYSDEMIKTPLAINLKLLYPEKCEYLGDEGLSGLVIEGIEAGRTFGLTQLGALQAYTRLILLLGRNFHLDPRWSATARILGEEVNQLLKAEALQAEVAEWLARWLRCLEGQLS